MSVGSADAGATAAEWYQSLLGWWWWCGWCWWYSNGFGWLKWWLAVSGGGAKFELTPYGDVGGMHACSDVAPLKLLLLLLWLLLLLLDGAIVPDDGDLVCAAFELCSDLMDSGVCDFIECASVLWPNRFADGGVCAPPVMIDDELESSSFSLSYVLCTGDFSPRLPWTYGRNKRKEKEFVLEEKPQWPIFICHWKWKSYLMH